MRLHGLKEVHFWKKLELESERDIQYINKFKKRHKSYKARYEKGHNKDSGTVKQGANFILATAITSEGQYIAERLEQQVQ